MNASRLERRSLWRVSDQTRDVLRNSLWFVPTVEIVAATRLFVITYEIDQAADSGSLTLPAWVNSGSADAARQILIGVAAAVITVVGLVFSILIVALTLASTQFGPRMLRTFIRDRGVQITLGTLSPPPSTPCSPSARCHTARTATSCRTSPSRCAWL